MNLYMKLSRTGSIGSTRSKHVFPRFPGTKEPEPEPGTSSEPAWNQPKTPSDLQGTKEPVPSN